MSTVKEKQQALQHLDRLKEIRLETVHLEKCLRGINSQISEILKQQDDLFMKVREKSNEINRLIIINESL